MKIASIVGTRPNLLKEFSLQRVFDARGVEEVLVHTGQHYDYEMSQVFFDQLGIRPPQYTHNITKGTHAKETASILTFVEDVLLKEKPDVTLVYGDVNTTLAGALASAKLRIPVAHVEAGVRSPARYNPEEINRRVSDVLAHVNFAVTQDNYDHLMREGYDPADTFLTGDLMLDTLLTVAREHAIPIVSGDYHVATVHRAENSDDPVRLGNIVRAFARSGRPIKFAVHPRTVKNLKQFGLWDELNACRTVEVLPAQGFLDWLKLMAGCDKVITDSGGVRREGYMLGKPVITLIDIVWFPEIMQSGWGRVADAASSPAVLEAIETHRPTGPRPPVFGDGRAAEAITDILLRRYG